MIIVYDFRLIALSVAIAILAAHGGLLLLSNQSKSTFSYKSKLVAGAIIIGGGIWTMHFVGMLALHMSLSVNYLVLPTLVSVLIAILLTGLSLYCTTSGRLSKFGLQVGAVLMGLGIASMHYTGMEALKSVCTISYSPQGVVLAVLIGIGASWLALKCMQMEFNSRLQSLAAASALGIAISAMHYVAMLNTQFEFLENSIAVQSPVLGTTLLACIVAVAVFMIINSFLLIALPNELEEPATEDHPIADLGRDLLPIQTTEDRPSTYRKLRIDQNNQTRFIDLDDIVFVSAEGHYTQIGYLEGADNLVKQICDRSLSTLSELLREYGITQCHRSHLVNLQHISTIERQGERAFATFEISESPVIPISRSKLPQFSRELAEAQCAV